MKLNQVLEGFTIQVSNEEQEILDRMTHITPLNAFPQREQFIIENLIRKALVTKVANNGMTMVIANELETYN
jgi:hypothetical protein